MVRPVLPIGFSVNPCPACGHVPEVRKAFLSRRWRLECPCGVAGQWSPFDGAKDVISGWEPVAGVKKMARPPLPMEKD